MKNLRLIFGLLLLIPVTSVSQVKINEVLYNPSTGADMIELKNFGSSAVNVSSMWFCTQFSYSQISTLTVVSGSTTIPAGGLVVLSGRSLQNSADLGLYNDINNNSSNFAVQSFMEDFVQWGNAGNGRESVANGKGIWTAGTFVTGVASGHSIEYDGDGNAASDWSDAATPSLGAENTNVTSVEEPAGIPDIFSLEQNFPNPFNPGTAIAYTIPQSAHLINVQLEIFNLLGQKVRTLISAPQSSGPHIVTWDGTNDSGNLLATGLYVYRLQAGDFVEMKKMLFMK